MTILFIILIILASAVLGFIVLVQNPKGGGLAGNVAGFSNQFMGVKQTTDVLEKGTWLFAGIIGVLCIFSVFFISKSAVSTGGASDVKNATIPSTNPTVPANSVPLTPQPVQPVPNK
jgi:preprotein translocase subunit SecG